MVSNARLDGGQQDFKPGTVVTYSCLWSTAVHSTSCQQHGTWNPDPLASFACPNYTNSSKLIVICTVWNNRSWRLLNHYIHELSGIKIQKSVLIHGSCLVYTMRCYRGKRLLGSEAVYENISRPLTSRECSAVCSMDNACQGTVLRRSTNVNLSPSSMAATTRAMRTYSCGLFSSSTQVTEAGLADDSSSTVCVHAYRNTLRVPN